MESMRSTPKNPKPRDIHIYLRDGLDDRLQAMALRERRSVTNMATVLLERALEVEPCEVPTDGSL